MNSMPIATACPSSATMQALLVISALAGALAASPQTIFFVNNSIEIPAFDSFIELDAISSGPLTILDNKVHSPHCLALSLDTATPTWASTPSQRQSACMMSS